MAGDDTPEPDRQAHGAALAFGLIETAGDVELGRVTVAMTHRLDRLLGFSPSLC